MTIGAVQCAGYPKGTTCIVSIPTDGRGPLCRYCLRTRYLLERNREMAERKGWRQEDHDGPQS